MESLFTFSDKFDHGVMDRFLNQSELPVIGSSALEQILHQASLDFSPAMSPDSSQWTNSTSGVESGSESLSIDGRNDSDIDCLPDSTTANSVDEGFDNLSVNSDPINSDGSEYSFAASPPVFIPVIDEPNNNQELPVATKRKVTGSDEAPAKKRSRKSKAGPTELSCPLCEYTTRVKEHLASHMNSHASERKYMCTECGQTFKWSHSLRRHQRTHQSDYKFTCTHCPKQFSRKDHLAVHEKLHDADTPDAFPCPQCGTRFKNKKTLSGHVKTHSTDKPHRCHSCDSAFTRKASLTRHILAAHSMQFFNCDICSAPFSYKSTLEDHRRAVHNEGKRDFHCNACGLAFACKAYLQKHSAVCKNRTDREEIPCDDCGKLLPTKRHLQEHRRNKHRDTSTPLPVLSMPPQNMGHNLGQYFSVKARTTTPVRQQPLPPFSRQMMTNQHVARCEVCHAVFQSEAELESHFMSHVPQSAADDVISVSGQAKVTGSDINLNPQMEPEPVEENVGSLLRQVYNTEHTDFCYNKVCGTDKMPSLNDHIMDYPSFDSFLYFPA